MKIFSQIQFLLASSTNSSLPQSYKIITLTVNAKEDVIPNLLQRKKAGKTSNDISIKSNWTITNFKTLLNGEESKILEVKFCQEVQIIC